MINNIEFLDIKEKLKDVSFEMSNRTNAEIFLNRIKSAQRRLDNEKMSVLIVGEFSRGKSTFINAILGKPILPAKVNPTTATINILEGNNQNNMIIDYFNEESKTIDLPYDKVNKFLDNFVTESNKDAPKIRKISLNIPGKLEEWDCILVDTPGVNDLDSAREEITFKYLSEADACIVLLDSQQPLSESERRFLKDKVLANDINRLLFVINKIDESEDIPDGSEAERLINHIRKSLCETLPQIKEPKIYAVSSKKALKSRFKSENSLWGASFDNFEKELVQFISRNASNGKLPEHIFRLKNITNDMINFWNEELFQINCSDKELKEMFNDLRDEERLLRLNIDEINLMIESKKLNLGKEIVRVSKCEFGKLKDELSIKAKNIITTESCIDIKSTMSQEVRRITENISNLIGKHKQEFQDLFYENINKIYGENNKNKTVSTMLSKAVNIDIKVNEEIIIREEESRKKEDTKNILKSMATGGTIGYVGVALFGPIGLAIGIIGAGVAGYKLAEKMEQDNMKKVALDINNQMNTIIKNAEAKAQEIAEHEINAIASEFKEIINNRIEMINISLRNKEKHLNEKNDSLQDKKKLLEENMQFGSSVLQKLENIEREL